MYFSISLKIIFIISYNMVEALVNPNGLTAYSNNSFLVQKAVFYLSPLLF